jgi:hypothetical protein
MALMEHRTQQFFPVNTHVVIGGFLDGSQDVMDAYTAERGGNLRTFAARLDVGTVLGARQDGRGDLPHIAAPHKIMSLEYSTDMKDELLMLGAGGKPLLCVIRRPKERKGVQTWVVASINREDFNALTRSSFMRDPSLRFPFDYKADSLLRAAIARIPMMTPV